MPENILRDSLTRKRKRIDRRSRLNPVFRMLTREYQDKIIEYLNQDWLCAGALFRKWPGPDMMSKDGTYYIDCPSCCIVCYIRDTCNNFKCQTIRPLSEMSNCQHWITETEYASILIDKITQTQIEERRTNEYFKYFNGFHIPEEIDRYVDPFRHKP